MLRVIFVKLRPRLKLLSFFIAFFVMMLLGCSKSCIIVQAAPQTANNITVTVDWDEIKFDVPPQIINGRTMVPLRAIFEALDAKVEWDDRTRTVTGYRNGTVVSLVVDSRIATLNGKTVELDVPAVIMSGRTLVPARFISESLGAKVIWNEKQRKVEVLTQDIIKIPDSNFEKVIRKSINKYSEDLYSSDLSSIKVLEGRDAEISNIEGIQYLKNVTHIYLERNNISDINPLSSLKKLEILSLNENRVADISPLSTMKNLRIVFIHTNLIGDLTPLAHLTNLEELYLGGNYIKDIEPLSELINLKTLFLGDNQITDLSALVKLEKLKQLDIYANSVLDLSPLKYLKSLEEVYIEYYNEQSVLDERLYKKYENMMKKAQEIVEKVIRPGMSDWEKELVLHDYLVANTDYDYENFISDTVPEESHQPYGVLINKVAVCDGFARTMQILLNMVGIECEFIHGESNAETGWYGHAWNLVKIDGKFYHLDVTFDNIDKDNRDTKNDSISHTYFNISDRQIALDHRWEKSVYPSCNNDSDYFTMTSELRGDRIVEGDNAYYIDDNKNIIKLDTKSFSTSSLTSNKAERITLCDGFIYYIQTINGDANAVYRVKTDGTEEEKVYDGWSKYLKSDGDYVYFIDDDDRIVKLTESGIRKITTGSIATSIYFTEDYVVYKAYKWNSGPNLYRINKDTGENSRIGFDAPSGFTFSEDTGYLTYYYTPLERVIGDWIYYTNADEGNSLFKIKVDGTGRTKLIDDDSVIIGIINDWLYYHNNSDNSKVYRVRIDGAENSVIGH